MWRKRRSSSSSGGAASQPLACPTCARGYSLDERFCPRCGTPLVYAGVETVVRPATDAHERARKIKPEYSRGDLVRVASGRHQAEAELIQNLLIEEGVPSVLRRSAGFDVPDFLAAGPRDVLVPQSGAEAASGTLLEAELVEPPNTTQDAGQGPHALRVLLAIVAGAGAAASIAWVLIQVAG